MALDTDPSLKHGFAYLRPIQNADLPRWLSYLRTDAVRQGISWRPQCTDELCEFVDSTNLHRTGTQVRFAIARTADDAMLGSIGFHSISLAHRSAEIAYDLHPDEWGQGLATAACRSVVGWGLRQGLTRIQSTVLSGNQPSLRVLQRSGFEFEGRLRKYRWVDGMAHDALMYSYLQT
ncbi:GNAT family N-acetyltransferase [Acidovorax sp. SUPP2522]|uniref:GNAT family N-acetyltransferase n=1 Tax=unclassified Acidovorax TaxID=2684926 RepID=UPI0032EA2FD2